MNPVESRSRSDRLAQITTVVWDREMGQRLCVVRMAMNIDQAQLGQLLGVKQGTISRIERGRMDVCASFNLARLKAVLGDRTAHVLYGNQADKHPSGHISKQYWKTRLAKKSKAGGREGAAS